MTARFVACTVLFLFVTALPPAQAALDFASPGERSALQLAHTSVSAEWTTPTAVASAVLLQDSAALALRTGETVATESAFAYWSRLSDPTALSAAIVPEPASITLLGLGIAGFALRMYLRRA